MDTPESMLLSHLQQAQRIFAPSVEHLHSAALRHAVLHVLAAMREAEQIFTAWSEQSVSLASAPEPSTSTPAEDLPLNSAQAALPSHSFLEEMATLATQIFTRHGITEDEMDVLWNYYAALAFESVWNQEGVFYEQVKRLFLPPPG